MVFVSVRLDSATKRKTQQYSRISTILYGMIELWFAPSNAITYCTVRHAVQRNACRAERNIIRTRTNQYVVTIIITDHHHHMFVQPEKKKKLGGVIWVILSSFYKLCKSIILKRERLIRSIQSANNKEPQEDLLSRRRRNDKYAHLEYLFT
mmetsp:Transcript_8921/g.19249  ORF Transcript_8921/g.19249 Transcript_8921/m.19249 type:complete len:151 (+) Transcript_8921:1402-1854(+)